MKTENRVLMMQAREALKGKWGLAIGTSVAFNVLLSGVNMIPKAGILAVFLVGPLVLGFTIFILELSRNQNPKFDHLFSGFKRFGDAFILNLLMGIFVLLWSLLLIVPGIIAGLSYSMAFYILADDPSIGGREALDRSKKMMYGYKWKLFALHLRFLGWALLSVFTLFIGMLWIIPYFSVAMAKFYDDLKKGSEVTPAAM